MWKPAAKWVELIPVLGKISSGVQCSPSCARQCFFFLALLENDSVSIRHPPFSKSASRVIDMISAVISFVFSPASVFLGLSEHRNGAARRFLKGFVNRLRRCAPLYSIEFAILAGWLRHPATPPPPFTNTTNTEKKTLLSLSRKPKVHSGESGSS